MSINWTIDQKKVIDTSGKNILVSAAAGSGKTTVLSERVIRKITDKENPVDCDRILVLTFTRAAAREMKAKITKNLVRLAEENPSDENLRRQLTLIHKAEITTIDSFCIKVYKNYFEDIGADPKKRIVNPDELYIIRDRVMEELLDQKFEEGDEAFLDLTSMFSRNDLFSGLSDAIIKIVDESAASPWPMEFFDSLLKPYEIKTKSDFENSEYLKAVLEITDASLTKMIRDYEYELSLMAEDDGYFRSFHDELPLLKAVLNETTFDGKKEALDFLYSPIDGKDSGTKFLTLRNKRSARNNPEFDSDRAKEKRDSDKKALASIRDNYFLNSEDEILTVLSMATPYAKTLISLTKEFYVKFQAEKEKERVMDFSDAEHMALSILLDENTKEKRSAADELSEYFDEVMVDEYQDSNDLQEAILKAVATEDETHGNYFAVGDVKQSIYRFRNANPNLFLKKYVSYDKEEGRDRLILLKQNFRSRSEVTDTVNHIFTELMHEDVGGLNYGEDESLNFAAAYDEPDISMKPEIHIVETDDAPSFVARKDEADMVCYLIEKARRELFIKDSETGEKRHPGYGDFAILSRSLSIEMKVIDDSLERHHIPHVLAQEGALFETVEIRPVLSLLRLIDNRRDDISVASVLKSPFYDVSDETLLKIRHEFYDRRIPFYSAVKMYSEAHPEDITLKKFFDDLKAYRKEARKKCIKDLITEIYDTGYLDYMTAYPDGEMRRENLYKLLDIASEYEKDNFKGLYRFNKYISLRKEYGYTENVEAYSAKDEVAVMTIHKSKGLEFPIVILYGAEKNFRRTTGENGVLIDRERGLFIDAFDSARRIRESTYFYKIDSALQNLDSLAEEQRLLYVALTRAKEKLYICGFTKNFSDVERQYEKRLPMSKSDRQNAKNYFDFVLPIAFSEKYKDDFVIERHEAEDEEDENSKESEIEEYKKEDFLSDFQEYKKSNDFAFRDEIDARLMFTYPYEDEVSYKTKYSVTEVRDAYTREEFSESENIFSEGVRPDAIRTPSVAEQLTPHGKGHLENSVNDSYEAVSSEEKGTYTEKQSDTVRLRKPTIPEFLQEKKAFTGNKRGTAVHRFMECFSFERDDYKEIYESELNRMLEKGMLSKEAADSISRDEIGKFLSSDLAERMHKAAKEKNLFREKAFMAMEKISNLLPGEGKLESTAEKLEPGKLVGTAEKLEPGKLDGAAENHLANAARKKENSVMVQGIIDAFFIEDDHIILLDYKTDKTLSKKALKDEYFKQLDIYRDVLTKATGLPVKEMMLYSFTIGSEIPLM